MDLALLSKILRHIENMKELHIMKMQLIRSIRLYFERGNEMAVKIKPVQPTEIKDKKIAREVIEQIRKPIPAKVHRRNEKLIEYIKQFEK